MSATVRHEWIDTWCGHLQRVLLAAGQDTPVAAGARLVALPAWLWMVPGIDVGRKAHRADGTSMLLPVRITWGSGTHLVALEPGTHRLPWTAVGMGHSSAGELVVEVDAAGTHVAPPHPDLTPVDLGPDSAALRDQVTSDATDARWQARMSLERMVTRAVDGALASVSADVLGARGPQMLVLDPTGRDQVIDQMLLGRDGDDGAVSRLIERSLAPGAFVRVDPLRYLKVDLQRSAEAYVRRAIGDPPIGRKIRRVQRSMPQASIDEVISAYRQLHPGDDLSTGRAARALTASADIMAVATFPLQEEYLPHDGQDVADQAIANASAHPAWGQP